MARRIQALWFAETLSLRVKITIAFVLLVVMGTAISTLFGSAVRLLMACKVDEVLEPRKPVQFAQKRRFSLSM